jgi:hypothetical protein
MDEFDDLCRFANLAFRRPKPPSNTGQAVAVGKYTSSEQLHRPSANGDLLNLWWAISLQKPHNTKNAQQKGTFV